jgi:hypothetical protein
MAAKQKAAKGAASASTAYAAVTTSPYVQRLIQDAELRDNIREAYESARKAYGRLSNGKAPTKALLEDKKLHKELSNAAEALRDAGAALKEGPKKKKKKRRLGRVILLGLVGGALALALSEGLRSKVLDLLFGAEEEFDYSSTTAPPTPAPQPASSSA